MKYIFYFISLCSVSFSQAQDANLAWAKKAGSTGTDFGSSIAVDAAGCVYVIGVFAGTVDFDPDPVVTNTLTSVGEQDIFIQKLNAAGNLVWVKRIGATQGEYGSSIAVDDFGNFYATGVFTGTVDFNPDATATTNFTSTGTADIFVTKFDTAGTLIWARHIRATSGSYGYANSIAANALGVYTTGEVFGTIDFDPGAATNNMVSAGSDDIFISKLDTAGNFVWARRIGGTLEDNGIYIATDVLGNVYTTGDFKGTVDFDPNPSVTTNFTSAGDYDAFVSKLDASGNFVWAKQFGSTSTDYGNSIDVDEMGSVYTIGQFRGTVDFNTDPGGTTNITSGSGTDIFIHKLDAAGNFVWAKRIGGNLDEYGTSIAVNATGIYFTGEIGGTTDFNPDPTATYNLTTFGSDDIYVAKLDTAGNFGWAKQIGGTSEDNGFAITADVMGNVYVTGDFQGTADFDPGTGTNNLTSAGNYDIFVLKLTQAGSMPITLSGFEVESERCTANLKWTTASEQNSSHFEVQQSSDGTSFSTIGKVLSHRNSNSEKQYSFTGTLSKQRNYFRLRLIDIDGSSTYSSIVSATGTCDRDITAYPNPAKNNVAVTGLIGETHLRLLNQPGQVVRQVKTTNSTERVSLQSLAPGNYILQVVQNNQVIKNIKIIKEQD